jgi:hypothetical protein
VHGSGVATPLLESVKFISEAIWDRPEPVISSYDLPSPPVPVAQPQGLPASPVARSSIDTCPPRIWKGGKEYRAGRVVKEAAAFQARIFP